MAGKRQHHNPIFLQKGFYSKKKEKSSTTYYYTWVYTKDKNPYESNMINIGLEKYFYGDPSSSTADDRITSAENRYSPFLRSLRQANQNEVVNSVECANFIGHMFIRSKFLRETVVEVGSTFQKIVKKELNKPKEFENNTISLIRNNRKHFANKIKELLPSELSKEERFLITKKLLDNPQKLASALGPSLWYQVINYSDEIQKQMPEMVKNSHNQVLEINTVSKAFTEITEEFSWNLLVYHYHTFILGDVGVICRFMKNRELEPLMSFKNNLESVYLPISKKHLLVGSSQNIESPIPSPHEINEAIVKLSRNYFISSINTPEMRQLTKILGKKSSVITTNDKIMFENRIRNTFQK